MNNKAALLATLVGGLGYLLPNHYFPWASFYNEFLVAAGIWLAGTALYLRTRATVRLTPPPTAAVLLLLPAIPLAQAAFSLIDFFGDAVISSLYLFGFAFSYVLGSQASKTTTNSYSVALAWTCLTVGLISLHLASVQWLQLSGWTIWLTDMPPGGRPYGNLAQSNNLATFFCCAFASAYFLRKRGHFGDAIFWLVGALLLAGVAMTRSRTPFLILLVLAGSIPILKPGIRVGGSRLELIGGLSIFLILWFAWPTFSEFLYLPTQSSTERLEGLAGGEVRFLLWHQLADAVVRSPTLGYGWGQVSHAQIAVALDYPPAPFTEYSHNLALDLLLWNGLFIGGGLIIAIGWWVISRLKSATTGEQLYGLLVILIIVSHALVELPLAYTYFLFPIGLYAGLIDSNAPGQRLTAPTFAASATIAASGMMLAGIFIEYVQLEADHRRLRFESVGIEAPSEPHNSDIFLFTQQREFIRFARTRPKENMEPHELNHMGKVARRYPYPPTLFQYALALGLNHRFDEASHQLQLLNRLHPGERSREAEDAWRSLSRHYPQLSSVEFKPSIADND